MGPEHVLHCWSYLHTAPDDMGMYMPWPTAKVMDEGLYEEENQIAVGGKPYAVAILPLSFNTQSSPVAPLLTDHCWGRQGHQARILRRRCVHQAANAAL